MESILKNSFRVKFPFNAISSVCTRYSRGSIAFEIPKNLASSRTPDINKTRKCSLTIMNREVTELEKQEK